jgi:hypothetical protein
VSAQEIVYRTASTELRVWSPAPGVLCSCLRGELTTDAMHWLMGEMQQTLDAHGSISVFHDWLEMTQHAPAARTEATRWVLDRRQRVKKLHVLLTIRSRVMSAVVESTNLVLGGFMRVHSVRASFERALAAANEGR